MATQSQQTQSQSSAIWSQQESQPMERIPWGILQCKYVRNRSLDLREDEIKIGRNEDCQFTMGLDDLPENVLCQTSKIHFTINKDLENNLNPAFITDESRNGTFLNGELIGNKQKRILRNDDVIALVHATTKLFVFKDLREHNYSGLPSEIVKKYHIGMDLGSGACGVVKMVFDLKTCKSYAMKRVGKNLLDANTRMNNLKNQKINDPHRVLNEVNIMKSLDHPCVIKMHDIVDNPNSLCIVLQLMKGGDLLKRITHSPRKFLPEKTAKLYFIQMCQAVRYLHKRGITHRDLKPDNVLLETEDEETLVKVSDFGLSKFVNENSVMQTLCGTPLYVAPEILSTRGRGSYTKSVDIWSLGVVLFAMLSGTVPFSDDYGGTADEQIKKGKFSFRSKNFNYVTGVAKSLIRNILTVDPTKRPSIDEILNHRWLTDKIVIEKAERLMAMKLNAEYLSDDDSDIENDGLYAEPAAKRQRTQ